MLKHGRMSAAATSGRHDQRPEIEPERTAMSCFLIAAQRKVSYMYIFFLPLPFYLPVLFCFVLFFLFFAFAFFI